MTTIAQDRSRGPRLSAGAASLVMAGFAVYGLAFAFLPEVTRAFPFEWVFFGEARPAGLADPAVNGLINLYVAIFGGLMAGWLTTLAILLRSGQRFVWDAALAGLAVWFVADSAGSVLAGFWQNAIFNAGFAIILFGALLASRPRA